MKNGVAIIILAILFSSPCFAQRMIKGIVVNKASSEPIAGGSVFISNTSKGTVTDKLGAFELNDIPVGKYDLVVSSVGYETSVYSFSTEELPLKLRFEMDVRVRELENVTVEASVEEGWDKWGLVFMDNFIGRTPNAEQCRIKNREAIHFRYYRKSNRIIAYSDEPLIIENRSLGYRINYQMENFEVNFSKGSSAFAGYPLFDDMDKNRRTPRSRWQKARDKAYYGSMMHFMRSVFSNSLNADGFDVRRMHREPNLEKQRIKLLARTSNILGSSGSIRITTGGSTANQPMDSSEYYQRILGQKDYLDTYGRDILPADSIIAEVQGSFKILYFPDYLYITYKKEMEDPSYLAFHREARKPMYQTSYIWLTNGNPIAIDANGSYFPPSEIFSMSYWAWSEKIADLIPADFLPEGHD